MNDRDFRMALDLLTGTKVDDIAAREGLKATRVYYLIGKVKYLVGLKMQVREKNVTAKMVGLYAQQVAARSRDEWNADSPRGFYETLKYERERDEDGCRGYL